MGVRVVDRGHAGGHRKLTIKRNTRSDLHESRRVDGAEGLSKWMFIGAPITPNGLNSGKAPFPEFHSVYVELDNFRYYQKNGKFPEGTVMVKELSLVQPGKHPDGSLDSASGRGYFPASLNGLDVMVKDSARFSRPTIGDSSLSGTTLSHTMQPQRRAPPRNAHPVISRMSLGRIWFGFGIILCSPYRSISVAF